MKLESKLLPAEEVVKRFVNDSDVMSVGELTAIDFETYSKKIKSNLASCVRSGQWRS